jgi:hypothetical protein
MMERCAQKRFDRADIVRDVREPLPAQTVDATLFESVDLLTESGQDLSLVRYLI